jgi:hypothetical protein
METDHSQCSPAPIFAGQAASSATRDSQDARRAPSTSPSGSPGLASRQPPSLDGRLFRVSEMAESGEASAATVFEYHERENVVWARYQGGAVRLGFLVGTRDGDHLEFRYSQLNATGETSNGRCSSTISVGSDGRVQLAEVWAWESKPGTGTSAVEETR